ncbi:unnamed protein product [Effrenium voratum]|nr:unnamed protein product [Effrenium voratum]
MSVEGVTRRPNPPERPPQPVRPPPQRPPPLPTQPAQKELPARHWVPLELELAVAGSVCAYLALVALVFCLLSEGKWSFTDGFYFCLVTLTTVGYGDLTPCSSPLCRILGMAFIWTNVLVVSAVLSIVGARVERAVCRAGRFLGIPQVAVHFLALGVLVAVLALSFCHVAAGQHNSKPTIRPEDSNRLGQTYLVGPFKEEKTLLDGLYFSTVTLSTVGYGAFSPSPQARLLMCPMLFIGVVSVGSIAGWLAGAAKSWLRRQLHLQRYDQPTKAVASVLVILLFAIGAGLNFKYVGGEDWSILEAIYFAVVTMTTVGYGDYAPVTTEKQKLMAVIFIWMSITLLAVLFGFISAEAEYLVEETEDDGPHHPLKKMRSRFGSRLRKLFQSGLHPGPALLLVLLHLLAAVLLVSCESWSLIDSLYFTSVTLTTVGYGDMTPKTSEGQLATTLLVLTGVPSTAALVASASGRFTEKLTERFQALED